MNRRTARILRALIIGSLSLAACFISARGFAGESEDLNFAKKLRHDGMYVAAAEEFLRFTEKYPQSVLRPEALFSAAESYLQAGKANDALGTYEKFIEAYPKDDRACMAHLQRGRVFKALKRYKEGADELLEIADENPACPVLDQAFLDAADCFMSMGNSDGAVKVLRRLINDRKDSQLVPRARYTLALALLNMGRDMEADKALADLVSMYPSSPVRALALIKLGERSLAQNNYAKAEEYFRLVEKDFKEDPLSEKAVLGIINIQSKKGASDELLSESERFIEKFPNSEMRPKVARGAVEAALKLKKPDKALALVKELKSVKAAPDSTGEISLLAARVLAEAKKSDEAIAELDTLRREHPASPFLRDALVLEAELRDGRGAPLEAARLYNLALMGDVDQPSRLMLNARLAELSASRLADTLSALRYWGLIADEDRDGSAAEEAIYRQSILKEKTGDVEGATRGFEAILSRFAEGKYVASAREQLLALSLRPVWNEGVGRGLARVAARDAGPAERAVETGAILVESARDAEGAIVYLEGALAKELPDSLRAKGSYYLGKARLMKSEAARARGMDATAERAKGLDLLRETAQKYAGAPWGERAQREYMERRFAEWNPAERIAKLDEYLNAYGKGNGRFWALAKKAGVLYERAAAGDTAAANTALAIATGVMREDAPSSERKEATLLGANLMKIKGDNAGAARTFESFVATYPNDPRATGILYELGETLIGLRDFAGASAAYDRCMERAPGRVIAEKCQIRKGDCLYYRGLFADAAAAYAKFASAYPESELGSDATCREALAQEKLGDLQKAEDILTGLIAKEGLPLNVRLRALFWLGERYASRRQYDKARPLLEELAVKDRTAPNVTLAGEAQLGGGDFAAAAKSFAEALNIGGVDTCRATAGRAKSYLRLKEIDKYGADMTWLAARCSRWQGLAGIMLEKGKIEAEEGNCEEAAKTLEELQKKYGGTEEGNEAFFYLALCDLKRGGYKEAADKLESFIAASPGSPILPQAYFKLGSARYGANDLNLAAKNYALAAESSKDRELSFAAWKNLGSVYQQMEKWDAAASTWQKLVETFPEREGIVEVFFDLGFCYSQAGKNELAYDVYIRIPDVATTEEQQGRAHYWAGMSLKALGRCEEAIREFLRVPYLKTGGMWGITSKLEAAGCYELTGDLGQAQAIYESVLAAHGAASDWGRVASEGLKRIEDKKAQGGGDKKAGETPGKKE